MIVHYISPPGLAKTFCFLLVSVFACLVHIRKRFPVTQDIREDRGVKNGDADEGANGSGAVLVRVLWLMLFRGNTDAARRDLGLSRIPSDSPSPPCGVAIVALVASLKNLWQLFWNGCLAHHDKSGSSRAHDRSHDNYLVNLRRAAVITRRAKKKKSQSLFPSAECHGVRSACCCSEPCMLKCLDTLWRDVDCFCTRVPSSGRGLHCETW